MRKLLLFLLMLGFAGNVAGQTLTHPQKVYIDPRDTGGADTLKIDGGLQAGPSGSVQVIAADGSISVSAAVADGTIGKIKFGSDCVAGQILIRNASGSPSYWDCGTASGAGGIQASDNNITITGTGWRFQNATVFGSSTTAQELIHVYNSSGIAGIALQNNLQDWRIRATNNDLQVSNGAVYPLTIKTNQIGLFTTAPASTYELELTGDFKLSGNFYNTGLYTGNIVPGDNSGYQTDKYDIGLPNVKWRNFYAASAVFDQFIQQNVLLYDGYLIVGKSSGKFSGAVSNVATTFISTSSHAVDDFILVRGKDTGGVFQTEYFKILNKSGVGPYTYTVTEASGGRNLDGSGANSWDDGTSYLVLGKLDDGRVEIYANAGIPRLSILSQNSTYSSFTEYVRLGGLDNAGGGGCTDSGRYGILLGLCSGNYLRYQNRTSGGDTDDGILYVKGTIMAGTILAGSTVVQLDASGLDVQNTGRIRGGKPSYGDSTAGFWLGYDSSGTPGYKFDIGNATEYLRWTGTDLAVTGTINANSGTFSGTITATGTISGGTISGASVEGGTIQTIANCGTATTACVELQSGQLRWYNSTPTLLGIVDGTGIRLTTFGAVAGYSAFRWDRPAGSVLGMRASASTSQLLYLTSESDTLPTGTVINAISSYGLTSISLSSTATEDRITIFSNDYVYVDSALGLGVASPTVRLDVSGSTKISENLTVDTNTLYIDSTNNRVGIGTTSPSYTLDVRGAMDVDTGTLFVDATNTRVGIGTATPGVALDVVGNANFFSGGTTNEMKIGRNANEYLSIIVNDQQVILEHVQDEDSGVYGEMIYRVDDDGTTTARHIFQKKSGAYADIEAAGLFLRNWIDGAGNGYACASVDGSGDGFLYYKTTAACGTSSIRFKENVKPAEMSQALAILDLTPVTYTLKENAAAGFQFGVIAEQAAGLGLEWLIERDEAGQPRTFLYDRVSLYLIPVVKQQQERIADLERRIAELEKKKY